MERCVNTEEEEDAFGTLYIQLPSVFSGGEINVYSGDEKEDINEFNLGGTGDNNLSCQFMCHYADCEYEMAKIKSGSRVLLRYSLHYFGCGEMPTTNMLKDIEPLTRSLKLLPQNKKMIILPTDDEWSEDTSVKYTAQTLLGEGINALDECDRVNAEIVKAAGKGWKLLIVNANMKRTETSYGYEATWSHVDQEYTIIEVFDEEGNDVTESMAWLDIAEFDCVSKRDRTGNVQLDNEDGMLLATKGDNYTYFEGCSNNWGVAHSESHESTGYDSDSDGYGYGRYHYDSDVSRTTTHQYKDTFLLAYDTAAEVDLMCLGGVKGVSAVASKIVVTQDCSLLDRLLSVVESDNESKFDISSCQQLLEMVTELTTRRRDALSRSNIDKVNKILLGLATSFEPSKELFATILTAGDKFGHQNLSVSVLQLLSDTTRLRQHEISSFLCRANFILELNKRPGNQFNYVENSIRDLSTHASTSSNQRVSTIRDSILEMIERHGWAVVEDVVKAALAQLHRVRPRIDQVVIRGSLIRKIQGLQECLPGSLQQHVVDFTSDFVTSMGSDINKASDHLSGKATNVSKFSILMSIYSLFEHGTESSQRDFGRIVCKSGALFSALLKLFSSKNQSILLDVFNKSLVQNSVTYKYCWSRDEWDNEGNVPPSIHIRKMLERVPVLASKVDGVGRLALHYAVASSRASFDSVVDILEANPEAASVSDPMSGLFPFQLAASNDNIGASFRLLCADPNLVLSGIQVDETDEAKKRKRTE